MMDAKCYKKNTFIWIPAKKNKVHDVKQKDPTSFQTSLRATLIFGQVLSLIPVVGISSDNAEHVRFLYTSWKIVYSFLSLVGHLFLTIMCIYKVIHVRTIEYLNDTEPIISYSTTCITVLMSYQVARSWPSLVQHIAQNEKLDPVYDSSLTYKCNVACAVVLIFGLIEYILSVLSDYAGNVVCHTTKRFYEGLVSHLYPYVFNYLPYSPVLGAITQFFHFQSAFIWNFSDLFVICMSYYLTSRLQHINGILLKAQAKYLPEPFWKFIRKKYCRATQLIRRVDNVISGITFISFVNNLYFTCLQFFNTLQSGYKDGACGRQSKSTTLLGGYEEHAYFIFSLVFQIIRSVALLLIASEVHTASKFPAQVLYNVPSPVYCVEVKMFLEKVHRERVALSGLQFFYVTRRLLLTVAGAIVTYELVMFEYTSTQLNPMSPNITATVPIV